MEVPRTLIVNITRVARVAFSILYLFIYDSTFHVLFVTLEIVLKS